MAKKIAAAKTKPAPRKRAAAIAAAPAAAATAASPKKTPLSVSIDYPQEGEIVLTGHYSVRVTAAGASQVQCRIDGGDWVDCREAVGHWWFEWMRMSGKLLLDARARSGKGRWTSAPARPVVVD